MNFKEIIQKSEIFSSRPTYDKKEILFYLVFLILLLTISILLKKNFNKKSVIIKPYNFYSQKFFTSLITCIIIGFMLLFLRWQEIPYLATPILMYLDLIALLIIMSIVFIYINRTLPQEISKFNQKNNYNKYIPAPRRK